MRLALLAWALFVIALIIVCGVAEARAYYRWENEYQASWNLADKSSTIQAKLGHLARFVALLEESGLSGEHNAAVYKTPDNSFDANLAALRTLVDRLREMKDMDPTGFAYQTAIQQVTEQEQGEAGAMLDVFRGCWRKEHYFLLWSWVGALWWSLLIVVLLPSAIFAAFCAADPRGW